MSLGTLIRDRRQYFGLSQKDLAEKIGLNPLAVRRWEAGETKPHKSKVPELSKALAVEEKVLYELIDEYEPKPDVGKAPKPVSEKAHENPDARMDAARVLLREIGKQADAAEPDIKMCDDLMSVIITITRR